MTDRELMQQALDVMLAAIKAGDWKVDGACDPDMVLEALRARLAQPEPEELGEVIPADEEQLKRIAKLIEPEPVAWTYQHEDTGLTMCVLTQQVEPGFEKNNPRWQKSTPLYAAPPQREWQTLTENEIKHLWYEACQTNLELTSQLIVHLARNIEAKLKDKNEY